MRLLRILFLLMTGLTTAAYGFNPFNPVYDVVVYGGSSAGVIAAVQAARMGKSVVLIEPSNHIGGMTASGLGWVDLYNPTTIGGIANEFFRNVKVYYQNSNAWPWEQPYTINGQLDYVPPDLDTMWVLEPHVGENIFNSMLQEAKVRVVFNEQLNRANGVEMESQRIAQITMESGRLFQGLTYIDATYEGDLMAAAGVSYIVGREPDSLFGETLNGVQTGFFSDELPQLQLSPYLVPGNPQKGLLPRILPGPGGAIGDGDSGVQAYNYRMCLTDVPQNRIQIPQPFGYNESQYEIVFRAIEAGIPIDSFFKLDLLPNRKTDSNSNGPISTDFVGMNWNYAEADYPTRQQIANAHKEWQQGLVWTLQNHPQVPQEVKNYYAPWGLAADEFKDNNHWPYRLYVREARRMISDVVITENMAKGATPVDDSVGLGCYQIYSHPVKYCVSSDGYLITEGELDAKVSKPFPISYRSIISASGQCENLFVTTCVSATHVAYSCVRIEPVLMVLGQSAATAACLVIDLGVAVQDLPYTVLNQQLLNDGQILSWPLQQN